MCVSLTCINESFSYNTYFTSTKVMYASLSGINKRSLSITRILPKL